MIPAIILSPLRLILGTIYPAYASYKALRTKTVSNLYKWTMYWIVFAILSSLEGVTDILFGFWLPLYIEFKILVLIWLIFPVSQRSLGSGIIYQRFIHRYLTVREKHIDRSIAKLKETGYQSISRICINAVNTVKDWVLNMIINAPEYASYLIQKYGPVEADNSNQRPSRSSFLNDVMNRFTSMLATTEEQYDDDRFEEIDANQEIQVIELENENANKSGDEKESQVEHRTQTNSATHKTNIRKQPRRKASSKAVKSNKLSDESNKISQDMEIDNEFDD